MGRLLVAAVVGGLIVFMWGAVSWMVLPFHTMSLNTLPGERAELEAMLSEVDSAGVYHFPGFPHHEDGRPVTDEEMDEMFERMRQGPVVSMMIVHPDGSEPFPGQKFATGLAISMLGALLLGLTMLGLGLSSFARRLGLVAAMAVFAVIAATLPSWLWWGYPALFGLLEVIDILIAWTLAGVVIAALVKPAAG